MFFDFNFHFVEALAIDADDGTLRDEGVGVDHLDEAEDVGRLALAGQQTDDLALLTGVPAVAVEDGDAMVGLRAEGVGYLLPLLREDEELHRLAAAVHYVVEHEVFDDHRTEAEHNLVDAFEHVAKLRYEQTGADDDEVDERQHRAERHVAELVDRGRNDVGAARRAVVKEDDGQGRARHHTADDQRHEVLTFAKNLHEVARRVFGDDFLCQAQEERQHEYGVDGLGQEFPAKNLQAHDEQQTIDKEIGIADGEVGGIVDDGADTGHAARYYLVGHQEEREAERVQ